ncbi:phosphonate C-P lyase system protein PhnH [Rhizobium mayense]|uniref:Phosphonate C-P lyase system protein PhnH n=1 Tax=Rhizobium mayense TaxID=1312184 RepID=A0ABT7K245_9HYPH|nr:phosphonate C-P lyase system protein PhnH [Rhizobium mayense]MDL2402080.1 phosphonate C-P lyase system protein PhnH [Rhizobium mayense]
MKAAPLPTIEDTRTNDAFEEMMWAMSRPGIVRTLPLAGLSVMAEALLDRECSYHVAVTLEEDLRLDRTGARRESLSQAQYVFATVDTADGAALLSALAVGTLAYPDQAATLFAPVKIGRGSRYRLTGPGIDGSIDIILESVDPLFWITRQRSLRYPLGWDVYLVDGDQILGIPRSTNVEVL